MGIILYFSQAPSLMSLYSLLNQMSQLKSHERFYVYCAQQEEYSNFYCHNFKDYTPILLPLEFIKTKKKEIPKPTINKLILI